MTKESILKEFREKFAGTWCHSLQKKSVESFLSQKLEEYAAVQVKAERQFVLNVLDGVDIADEKMGLPHDTKSIRFALQSRTISPTASLPDSEGKKAERPCRSPDSLGGVDY